MGKQRQHHTKQQVTSSTQHDTSSSSSNNLLQKMDAAEQLETESLQAKPRVAQQSEQEPPESTTDLPESTFKLASTSLESREVASNLLDNKSNDLALKNTLHAETLLIADRLQEELNQPVDLSKIRISGLTLESMNNMLEQIERHGIPKKWPFRIIIRGVPELYTAINTNPLKALELIRQAEIEYCFHPEPLHKGKNKQRSQAIKALRRRKLFKLIPSLKSLQEKHAD